MNSIFWIILAMIVILFYGIIFLNIQQRRDNKAGYKCGEGDNYDDLEELYGEMVSVYRRYVYHVHNIVGGVNQTLHNTNQKGIATYANTPKATQIAALNFLNRELWNTPNWLMDPQLVSNFKSDGNLKVIQNLQRSALNRLLSVKKLNKILSTSQTLVGNGLTVDELLQTLFSHVFESRVQPNSFERALQLHFINQIKSLMDEEKLHPEIKALLNTLQSDIHKWSKKKKGSSNRTLKTHFQYCFEQSSSK